MYPPRSRRRDKRKASGHRRPKRVWVWMNSILLLLIIAILSYVFMEGSHNNSTPPPAAQSSATTSPEASKVPVAETTTAPASSPQASIEPTFTAEPVPVETSEAEIEASPSPTKSADSGGISGLPQDADSEGETVKLSFGGDVIFAGKVGELLKKTGYDYPYAQLNGLFTQDDLSIVNLETPVTEGGTGAPNKQFVFKSPPEALDGLKAAGIDAVNLANNHTLDQGEQGLRDTLSNLESRGIPYVGAGVNEESAYTAQYFERKGIKIAVLGFTRVIPHADWQATKNKPGVASVYDSEKGLKAITEAKKQADLVVVIVHWGTERASQADAKQQSLGHSFIDAGADLVIGGHPHVLQGIEPYKGKWIAYSTGNFIFTRSKTPATWETAVFQAECNIKSQCSIQLKPFDAELGQPVPMNPEAGQMLFRKVESLSWGLITIDSEGKVAQSQE